MVAALLLSLALQGAAYAACGSGGIEMGEECDDGALNGTLDSCCSATCAFQSAGTACTDTTPTDCFRALCNGSGACSQAVAPQTDGTACTPSGTLPDCTLAQCSGGFCAKQAPVGTSCTTAPGECYNPVCSATGTCGIPKSPGETCTDSTPSDCFRALCNGSGECSQSIAPQMDGTACTPSGTLPDCTLAQCSAGFCAKQAPVGTPCTTSPGECYLDVCSANGTCGIPKSPGETCTDSTPSDCFRALCNGSGECSQSIAPQMDGTVCTPSGSLPDCYLAQCASGFCAKRAPTGAPCTTAPGECYLDVCNTNGTCGVPKSAGDPCTDSTPGDCFRAVCNGDGECRQSIAPQMDGTTCTPSAPLPDCTLAQCSSGFCAKRAPLSTPCTTAPGECYFPACDMNARCGIPKFVGTTCTDSTLGDCFQAECDGAGGCNQTAEAQAQDTPCTDTTSADCYSAQCDAIGGCSQTAALKALGVACGSQTVTDCDLADSCDVQGACLSNFVAQGADCPDIEPGNCALAQCDGDGACDQHAAAGPCPAPVASESGLLGMIACLALVGGFALWRRAARP